MQISKSSFVICAVALLAAAPYLRAAESEAQAKAREALRQKMSELDAQAKGKPAPAPTAPAPAPPPIVTPAPISPAVAPAPSRVDDEATARAREAMRQKLRELDAQKLPASAPAPSAPIAQPQTPPPTVVAPVTVTAAPPQPIYASTPVTTDDEATARARAALRQKMAELDAQQPSTAQAWPGGVTSVPDLKPLPAPPSPFSGHKEARLADLLRRYKADEITPEQYHKQRAKILTEP